MAEAIGEYRGFVMELDYPGEWRITLKGALYHEVKLGTDISGNITRLDNVLDAMPQKLASCEQLLADTKVQLENAKAQGAKPFPQEAELKEKTERLDALNIQLNMDEKDTSLDTEPEAEADTPAQQRTSEYRR